MSAEWDKQVQNEIPRYRSQLGSLAYLGENNEKLKVVINAVLTSAANRSLNAGYSGSHSDGGASSSVSELKSFLEGYQFANGGEAGSYQQILDTHLREKDPEYQKYLELKNKFEKK